MMSGRLNLEGRAQADWKREVENVTHLQSQVASLTEQLARSQAAESKSAVLREKLAAALASKSELRGRVRQLEDLGEKKDALVKDWNQALTGYEVEAGRLAEENQQLLREQEAVKSALYEFAEVLSADPPTELDDVKSLLATIRLLIVHSREKLGRPTERGSGIAKEDAYDSLQAEMKRLQNKNEQLVLEIEQLRIQESGRSDNDGNIERLISQVESYESLLQERTQTLEKCKSVFEEEKVPESN